jgi:serine/threonine-protein kinase ATR
LLNVAKRVSAPHFYLGRYCDDLFKAAFDTDGFAGGPAQEYANQMIRHYTESLKHGAKFIYQAMPRLLTVYMEMGDSDPEVIKLGSTSKRIRHEAITTPPVQQVDRLLKQIGKHLRDSLEALPHWQVSCSCRLLTSTDDVLSQWLVSLQQLVSRIAHANDSVFAFIELVLLKLLAFFPHPTFWAMVPVRNSAHSQRKNRCDTIFTKLPTDPETLLEAGKERIADAHKISRKGFRLVEQLLYMANYEPQSKDKEKDKESILKIDQHFPNLIKCMPCPLQIPLQSSLTVTLPAVTSESSGASNTKHRPFPKYLPTFKELENDVEIMSSLIRPKKFTCKSNLGQTYSFLCKPQDDLRKDARLMEFNSVINKLLKKDSESRKRGLHIRTYAVVPINEACGLIQWVSNTIGLRHILSRLYEAKGLGTYPAEVRQIYEHIRDDPNESANIFNTKVLPMFPPIFHEWFLEMFPEPSTWFTNRQAYARTTAVMSMVGFVLGLGDRHGENILYDATCGDTVHVDFNCLFDKGRTFEVSEKVPFRLTQNIVDGFGVMGVEGVFRRSAEVTMKILRANHEALMSVMESFVHDPLLEWSVKKSTKSKKVYIPRS